MPRELASTVNRGVAYFFLVFATGFVLGLIRVPFLVPRFGERIAEFIEAPIMLIAIYLAAKYVVSKYPAVDRISSFYSGLLALAFLLFAEIVVVLALRGTTLPEYVSDRDPVTGGLYILMLLIFAVMPWLVSKPEQ